MKYAATIATASWQIYEKVNPLLDAWQIAGWVYVHLFGG